MKKARRRSGKTQEQVAEEMTSRLGRASEPVHFTTISRWENGHLQPELSTLVAYAGAVGVGDFRELLEEAPEEATVQDFDQLMRDLGALIRVAASVAVREERERVEAA